MKLLFHLLTQSYQFSKYPLNRLTQAISNATLDLDYFVNSLVSDIHFDFDFSLLIPIKY
jgi:hypothetical protein